MKADPSIKTPAQYLAQLPDGRREAIETIHKAIIKAVPELKPVIVYGMLGYGPVHYKTKSGCEGDWAVVCLANQKQYISLYLGCDGDTYLAEKHAKRLGKVSCGKSCVRFKKLEDLNLEVALELIKKSAQKQAWDTPVRR